MFTYLQRGKKLLWRPRKKKNCSAAHIHTSSLLNLFKCDTIQKDRRGTALNWTENRLHVSSKIARQTTTTNIILCMTTQREKKGPRLAGPTHSDHYCTWSSGVPTVHNDAVVPAHHLGASSEPIIPAGEANVLFRCVWDCKVAAVHAEGHGAGNAAHPCAVRPTSQTSVGGRSVNFPGFGAVRCGAGQRYIWSPRASLVGVAV